MELTVGWIPGWESVESTTWWSAFYFWASIVALIGLGVSEVASHRYSERKDELSGIERAEKDRQHDQEIARVHLQASQANERASNLDKETEALRADNLTLQAVLAPRHVGVIGFDGPAPADRFFAGLEGFAGTQLLIQPVSGDSEAENLANEIVIASRARGWRSQIIGEHVSNIASRLIREGVTVLYPTGKPWTEQEPTQPWFAWASAANALAKSLTMAELGIGDAPISAAGFDPTNQFTPDELKHFDPPLIGVYVQVGARPISLTLQWMAVRRRASVGAAQSAPIISK